MYLTKLYRKIEKVKMLVAFAKSFMYMMNNSGPKIEPCGTPVVIDNIFDLILLISVYCLHFLDSC